MEAALLTDRNRPPVSRRSRVHECRPPSGFTSPQVHFVTRSLVGVAFPQRADPAFFFLHFQHHLIWGEIILSRHVRQRISDSASVAKHFGWRDTSKETEQAVKYDLWPLTCSAKVKCRPEGNWANHFFFFFFKKRENNIFPSRLGFHRQKIHPLKSLKLSFGFKLNWWKWAETLWNSWI